MTTIEKLRAEIQTYADNEAKPNEMKTYYHWLQIIDKYEEEEYRQKIFSYLDGVADGLSNPIEQEPCEDAVSKQAVIDTLKGCECMHIFELGEIIPKIKQLPSVQPKAKTGRWVLGGYDDHYYICDKCDCIASEYYQKPKYNYCPNCGARMEK